MILHIVRFLGFDSFSDLVYTSLVADSLFFRASFPPSFECFTRIFMHFLSVLLQVEDKEPSLLVFCTSIFPYSIVDLVLLSYLSVAQNCVMQAKSK